MGKLMDKIRENMYVYCKDCGKNTWSDIWLLPPIILLWSWTNGRRYREGWVCAECVKLRDDVRRREVLFVEKNS